MNDKQQKTYDNNDYSYFVSVQFDDSSRPYFFGLKEDYGLKKGDDVIVETANGLELGKVVSDIIHMSEYKITRSLSPIIRKATFNDVRNVENNKQEELKALEITKKEIDNLKLKMNLLKAKFNLDRTKILITYLADERVDFRELIKVLAVRLHTRIELRQIGPRDKAKTIGGIGMCGLPMCCSIFLNEFDGISINRAKNQMLTINIPKLSGQCGKLMCCLKYEDETYIDLKKHMPEIGTKVKIDNIDYTVTSINVISKTVKVESEGDSRLLSLEEFKKITNWKNSYHYDSK